MLEFTLIKSKQPTYAINIVATISKTACTGIVLHTYYKFTNVTTQQSTVINGGFQQHWFTDLQLFLTAS